MRSPYVLEKFCGGVVFDTSRVKLVAISQRVSVVFWDLSPTREH